MRDTNDREVRCTHASGVAPARRWLPPNHSDPDRSGCGSGSDQLSGSRWSPFAAVVTFAGR